MAVRLLDAPGIEIHEIDKSQYTPSMSGTKCYVIGFASKGEPYIPMQFTSRSAWQNYYGEPDNEAERYFYNACSEVINQNGTLYCARLPYDNASLDKMVAYKYKVLGNQVQTIKSFTTFARGLSGDENIQIEAIKWGIGEYLTDDSLKGFVLDAVSENESEFYSRIKQGDSVKEVLLDVCTDPKVDEEIESEASQACSAMYETNLFDGFLSAGLVPTDEDEGETNFDRLVWRYCNNYLTQEILESTPSISSLAEDEEFDPYHYLTDMDSQIDKYIEIKNTETPYLADLSAIDEYRTGESMVANNSFVIVDKTCATLKRVVEDDRKGEGLQLIGTFPVVTTAANALYAQSLISVPDTEVSAFETLTTVVTTRGNELRPSDLVVQFSNAGNENLEFDGPEDTISMEANTLFPSISMNEENTHFVKDNLKKIGVIVYQAYLDPAEGNKVSVMPVEAFVGSLGKDDVNPNTGVTTFIDTIVNSQSEYIYFFSNCFNTAATRKNYENCDIFIAKPGNGGMFGFYEDETEENISIGKSIVQGMDKCFSKVQNIDERDIDIVCDAGISNIAQYLKSIFGKEGSHPYDLTVTDDMGNPLVKMWKCKGASDVKQWKSVIIKFDNFCKNVRKDCMFVCDGPRPLVLQGEKKIIRESKPQNTIDANILPYIKWVTGLNTNYGAGYLDWFQVADDFTGDYFWCPPSIKAMGVYINTDLNFQYWDAPAGLNRGIVQALDVAFSPTNQQAGPIYTKCWNYAIDFPNDGITLWGQRTLQTKPSALDRVNVRRLCLRLERQVYKVSRYFLFEGNTAYTRRRLVDLLDPVFMQAKIGGGLYDYRIICDESINTPQVIDNNELRLSIGIKPVKSIEYIICNFTILSTGGSWDEME